MGNPWSSGARAGRFRLTKAAGWARAGFEIVDILWTFEESLGLIRSLYNNILVGYMMYSQPLI